MPIQEFQQLHLEHAALMQAYKEVQARCTQQIQALHKELEICKKQMILLRSRLIARDTALAWKQEQHQFLLTEWLTTWRSTEEHIPALRNTAGNEQVSETLHSDALSEPSWLESSLLAADLVICQTGCISDGDYWRVENHCKRTGKPCVLVEPSEALRVVRLHACADGKVVAAPSTLESTL